MPATIVSVLTLAAAEDATTATVHSTSVFDDPVIQVPATLLVSMSRQTLPSLPLLLSPIVKSKNYAKRSKVRKMKHWQMKKFFSFKIGMDMCNNVVDNNQLVCNNIKHNGVGVVCGVNKIKYRYF